MPNFFQVPLSLSTGLARRHRLAVHEVSKSHVLRHKAHLRPYEEPDGFSCDPHFPTARASLEFSRWQLFHAIKKAELARPSHWLLTALYSFGSWLEHFDMVADTTDFRLNRGAAKRYGDFVGTTQAGRFGQGLAYLFMQSQGYPYGMRFDTLISAVGGQGNVPEYGGWQPPVLNLPGGSGMAPDFIFCSRSDPFETALAEAKGAFVFPGDKNPYLRGPLAEGLGQLAAWDGRVVPAPGKSYVTNALLRELGDHQLEPSVLVYVDPESREQPDAIRYEPHTIIRANVAGWLLEMGLKQTANSLLSREAFSPRKSRKLIKIRVRLRRSMLELCLVPWGYENEPGSVFLTPPAFSEEVQDSKWFSTGGPNRRLFVSGLTTAVMNAVSASVNDARQDFKPPAIGSAALTSEMGLGVEGSLFADGTFFGFIDRDKLGEEATTMVVDI